MARSYLEDKIQAAVIAYLRLVAPNMIWAAVPNGGLRTKAEAAKFKWTGVLAGFPDIIGIDQFGLCYLMEIKTEDGVLSESQKEFNAKADGLKIPRAIVRSIDDARAALKRWRIATKDSTTGRSST